MRRSLQPVGCARAGCALHRGHLVPRPCHPDTRRYTKRVRLLCAQPDTKYKSTTLTPTYCLKPIPMLTSLIIQHHNIREPFVSVRYSNEFQFQVWIFLKPIAFYRWAWQDNLRKEELDFLSGFFGALSCACDSEVSVVPDVSFFAFVFEVITLICLEYRAINV